LGKAPKALIQGVQKGQDAPKISVDKGNEFGRLALEQAEGFLPAKFPLPFSKHPNLRICTSSLPPNFEFRRTNPLSRSIRAGISLRKLCKASLSRLYCAVEIDMVSSFLRPFKHTLSFSFPLSLMRMRYCASLQNPSLMGKVHKPQALAHKLI
jgi:hypothetical protein